MRFVLCAAITSILAMAACATMKSDETICPEYRELRCMTDTQCTMDKERACQVCRCAPALENETRPTRPDESQDPSGQTR